MSPNIPAGDHHQVNHISVILIIPSFIYPVTSLIPFLCPQTGVFTNNSMLSILTVNEVQAAESWTCMFIVDRNNFSAVSEIDTPGESLG